MKKRWFTHFICALLLALAQQAAVAHAVWHAHAPAHHENEGDASFSELCVLDAAFAQVLGGVQATDLSHPCPQADAETIEHRPGAQVVLELHVPLSRGPPALS